MNKNAQMKTIVLCADDFSLNASINAGILDLLEKKRLSAVSCMTQSPTWNTDAQSLLPWKEKVDIGLHFNLTQPFPQHYSAPLSLWMLQSQCQLISKQKVQASFCKQLDAFESAMKSTPDFIDGHQHVHLFPVIRDIVVKEYVKRYGKAQHKPYMRTLEHLPADTRNFKAKVLQAMGATAHARLLAKNNIPHIRAFAGLYDFNPAAKLDAYMKQWLAALPDHSLIMCHPAKENYSSPDVIAQARLSEYKYLSSESFTQTLRQQHVTLIRFPR